MKRIIFIMVLSLPLAHGQLIKLLPSWTTYSSKGLFDHRGGFSFYSVSKVRSLSEKRQLHLSVGSSLFIHSVTAGMRNDFDSPLSFFNRSYVVTSLALWALPTQTSESMNLRPVASVSLGLEKDLSEKTSLHMGLLIGGSMSGKGSGVDIYPVPTLSYVKRW